MEAHAQDRAGPRVEGNDGLRGRLITPLSSEAGAQATVELEEGTRVVLPVDVLRPMADGSYRLPLSRAELGAVASAAVIPVIAEQVDVAKTIVDVARVRISKRVSERVEEVTPQLAREEITVERVAVNQYVDSPPGNRTEGDALVVPLLEEVLVVEKRLLVREELRIRKTLVPQEGATQQVTLRREDVDIERVALDGSDGSTTKS
ncbi:MAG: YsnF/AvaK domain-containing protein [Myxococcota bacterium]|nr:YsnF/AvaK domain-containing protein [Myxococcota bacterium]